ncbi:MAG: DNA-binding protein [Acidobacteria bacterium]|nr:MAG: DNA-binding protein [Acidobacteriota bacterium]
MAGTLVDSNVILDVATEDAEWVDWSAAMLEDAGERGPLVINPLIFAEVSVRYWTLEDVDEAIPAAFYTRAALPWEAAFLAAKAFERDRRAGGARRSPLPDFFIGAHAAIAGLTLLTRDPKRYRRYFPKLRIISP